MIDQIEIAEREAAEAKSIAERTEARLDGIEGKRGWFSALGYAKYTGVPDTSVPALARLGRRAAAIARANDIEPNRVQDYRFGTVNLLPVWVWAAAAEEVVRDDDSTT